MTCGICGASFGTFEAWEHHRASAHPVQKHIDTLSSAMVKAISALSQGLDPKKLLEIVTPTKEEAEAAREFAYSWQPTRAPPVSPATLADVYEGKKVHAEWEDENYDRSTTGATILSSIPFINADRPVTMRLSKPSFAANLKQATEFFYSDYKYGVEPYIQRYQLRRFTPYLPGYQDMISVYMREGYMAEKWVEIPDEFVSYIKELGFSEFWAYRLWGKHWVLPSVEHLYEMLHKKIIDYDTLAAMLKYHDFEPVWRQRLIDNAYTMVPRVDLRRAYVWGLLREEQLQERYEWLGYRPADALLMKDIAKRFGLSAYYSRLLTVASASFRKGQLSGGELQAVMERCGLPLEAQNLIFAAEKMARDAAVTEPGEEPRVLTASQILSAYSKQFLSLSAAKARILALGYLEGDADLLLSLATPKPEPAEANRELVSAASLLYRNGLLAHDHFAGYLRKAGLSEAEIEMKVDAEDLRYRLDFATDLITMAKEAYRKDVYTAEELEAYLLWYGMQPERAATLVSIEELRKIPKPRLAG